MPIPWVHDTRLRNRGIPTPPPGTVFSFQPQEPGPTLPPFPPLPGQVSLPPFTLGLLFWNRFPPSLARTSRTGFFPPLTPRSIALVPRQLRIGEFNHILSVTACPWGGREPPVPKTHPREAEEGFPVPRTFPYPRGRVPPLLPNPTPRGWKERRGADPKTHSRGGGVPVTKANLKSGQGKGPLFYPAPSLILGLSPQNGPNP